VALVSYPSVDVSLKDGYAVKSTAVVYADRQKPVYLKVAGSAFPKVKNICAAAMLCRSSYSDRGWMIYKL
jgi:hypothetical protein